MKQVTDPVADEEVRVVCAWCGGYVRGPRASEAGRVSHGMCLNCAREYGGLQVDSVFGMSSVEADVLPWGRLVLDRGGFVRAYNRYEERLAQRSREQVIGRHFFRDVAPCTSVSAFEGRFVELVEKDEAERERFEFIFEFDHGARLVEIAMAWDPAEELMSILVKDVEAEVA